MERVYIDIRKGKGVFEWLLGDALFLFRYRANRKLKKAKAKASLVFDHISVFAFSYFNGEKEF